MITLENDNFLVKIEEKGAEISKFICKKNNVNYMWKQDPALWGHSAPILFPIVGALKNGETYIDNKIYKMNQHGFSRNTLYKVTHKSKDKVTLLLQENEETLKVYPFRFNLEVTYILKETMLTCLLNVTNPDTKDLYFQIGGHPAFACPFYNNESSNDYYIEMSQEETLNRKLICVNRAGMSHSQENFFEKERRFFVRQALFNDDAIVFPHFKSESITLQSILHQDKIVFHMTNFDHVGLWASRHVGGLLAIEPWVGHTDYIDSDQQFLHREGIKKLESQQSFECLFSIELQIH